MDTSGITMRLRTVKQDNYDSNKLQIATIYKINVRK